MTTSTDIPEVDAATAQELVNNGQAVLVDVREADEWQEAHIPGALHVPLAQVVERAAELPAGRTLILQCRSGARSLMAAEALRAIGRDDVCNLSGGILAWARSGRPIEA